MRTMRLGDLCEIKSGGTPRRSERAYYGGPIPWAKIGDLDKADPVLSATEETLTTEGLRAIRGRIFPAGSILLAMYGSVGKLAIAGIELTTNQAILGIRVRDEGALNVGYLRRWLESIRPKLVHDARGVTQQNISATYVRNLRVPVPEFADQLRIAALVDKANAIRVQCRENVSLIGCFLDATFFQLFGDPVRNERNWHRHPASDAIASIEAGSSVGGVAGMRRPQEWAVLKISSVTTGDYLPEECKVIETLPHRVVVPSKGDLLFSRANTRELVAATCLVDRTEPRLFLPDKLWRLTPNASLADAAYLRYLFAHSRFRAKLTAQATGTSGSMLNVSQAKLLRMDLPLPPLELQLRFGALVWKTIELRQRVQEAAAQADRLLESVVRSAFERAA